MRNKTKFYIYIIFSFMGIIVHEFSHQLFCQLAGVKVFKVKYFQLKNPAGFVEHAAPRNFLQAFFISMGPFFFGTILAFLLFLFTTYTISHYQLNPKPYTLYPIPFATWFALAIAIHSFPSSGDAKVLLSETNYHVFHRFNPFAAIVYPFVLIIKLANYLKKWYFDWIYAIFIFGIAIYIGIYLL